MIDKIRNIINDFANDYYRMGVAEGVPLDMRDGPINDDGWVEWKVIQSNVKESEIINIEEKYSFKLPPYFSGYLQACSQLLDQVHSNKYGDQLIFMSCCPSDNPLKPLTDILEAWSPLIHSGYIPFAEWGDGWGPMCLDLKSTSNQTEDYNIIWFDHEEIIPLGEDACKQREKIASFAKPLYASFKEFFYDVYAKNA
jgi:hypothetical protein